MAVPGPEDRTPVRPSEEPTLTDTRLTWLPNLVHLDDLGPYPAQTSELTWKGFACPRFTLETARAIAADTQRAAAQLDDPSSWQSVHVVGDRVEIRSAAQTPASASTVAKVLEADSDGLFHIGSNYWVWSELDDRNSSQTAEQLRQMRRTAYPVTGPERWCVTFADYGWRMVLLGVLPEIVHDWDDDLFADFYTAQYTEAISSYTLTADSAAEAYAAARRHFGAERAGIDPVATVMPLAFPFHEINSTA
ncbi:hypothetical protein [Kitasatospora purpeofusca]|uniref:hypothetical protein n=1 Tax=Kitasatospora purpeofusca TaxID=67352 RepID=UPI0035E3122C